MVNHRAGVSLISLLMFMALMVGAVRVGRTVLHPYWDFWRFRDRMRQELGQGQEVRSDSAVLAALRAYADTLALPREARRLRITREAGVRRIDVTYTDTVRWPARVRAVSFHPDASSAR